jgi:hypothetical protein
MNMTNEESIDPLLGIEIADFLELSASQEEILIKSLEIASTETHTAVGNTGQTDDGIQMIGRPEYCSKHVENRMSS